MSTKPDKEQTSSISSTSWTLKPDIIRINSNSFYRVQYWIIIIDMIPYEYKEGCWAVVSD